MSAGDVDADRFGMVFGTGIGGIGLLLDGHKTLLERGPRRVSPFMLPHMLPDSPSGQVAIEFGIRGPNTAVVSACATGGHAIGEAMETIVRGEADIMLGAGTEAPLLPLAFAGFGQMRALGTPRDPDTGEYNAAIASRPFDATRNGFVVSEGVGRPRPRGAAARARARRSADGRGHRLRVGGGRLRHGGAGGAR